MAQDFRGEADERLRRVVRFAQSRQGSLRTHLDEWAAYEFGGELLTRGGRQRWFNNPCPWTEWRRLTTHMDWITPEAALVLRRGMDRDPAVKKPRRGQPAPYRVIVEHAVPVKVIGETVSNQSSLWQPDRLREFLRHHFKRGVLTSAEDARLNEQGLRQRMPPGWQAGGDPFARYNAVRLQRARITGL
jgi:hypothetical protein